MKFRVLIPQDITEPGKRYLEENNCEISILDDCSIENICKNIVDCDAILTRTAMLTQEVFESGKKLKVIAKHGVGYDNVDVEAATRHHIQVCYTPEANAGSVAEHTMALILACAKKLVYMNRITINGQWEQRNRVRTMNVAGKTLGIIGYGRIGHLVAKAAAYGFDMQILVFCHHPGKNNLPDYVTECSDINDIFKKSDFVSIHSSLTEETIKLVNKERLQMMKNTAFLINTARGGEVDETALYEALYKGTIGGAGLDVFEEEPASKENPLFTLDNVIVSPHNASLTQEAMDQMGLDAAKGIIEVLYGKKVTWPVN
ncbi:hydroxyacid dehydrogenase [[Clostridium] fimetarium]|uniref:D-3-phosphoglycerate dehydrogenase n=1 Tax=[Clostridium] fimetarium TaxID=99656 RepID=A0A1I0PVK0_9FIRM|nr:hydroxyacid dehydrogenase [[Clostridium] fimetarium]SEW18499.1 D-3-phosphoglycerate dehydrogenase [[Clostridium] fimetarium]